MLCTCSKATNSKAWPWRLCMMAWQNACILDVYFTLPWSWHDPCCHRLQLFEPCCHGVSIKWIQMSTLWVSIIMDWFLATDWCWPHSLANQLLQTIVLGYLWYNPITWNVCLSFWCVTNAQNHGDECVSRQFHLALKCEYKPNCASLLRSRLQVMQCLMTLTMPPHCSVWKQLVLSHSGKPCWECFWAKL